MALRQTKKISELTALESASLQTTLLGVDNGTTYKITLDVLEDAIINMVSRSTDLRLDSLEVYTASANAASDLSPLNSFTSSQNILNSAFTTGINARLQTSSFNEFSASVNTRIIAATNEQSFNGLISGSSQLTSSYDSRYVLSGSITQTTWDNISGKPDGLVSQSTNLSSLNTFTASYFTDSASIDNRIDSLESWSSSLNSTFATDLEVSIVSSSVAATIGVISQNTGLVTTSSFNSYTASISTASLVTSITNLNTYTASQSTSSLVNRLNAIENVSGSWITESETGSFLTSLNGAISSSSQLTSSFDTRYALSSSYLTSLNGAYSSSIQTLGGSGVYSSSAQLPSGLISGSSQLPTLATTGSNTFNGTETISGSLTVTGSTLLSGYLTIGTGSGDEGGEFLLAKSQTNNSITGSGIVVDVFQNRVRIFEQGGNFRGAHLNILSQSVSVGSSIVTSTNVSTIQTLTSASYAALTPVSGTLYIIIG